MGVAAMLRSRRHDIVVMCGAAGWPEGDMSDVTSSVPDRPGALCLRWLIVVIWLVVPVAAGAGVKIGGSRLVDAFINSGSPLQRGGWTIPCLMSSQSSLTCRTYVVYSSGEL